MAVVFRIAGQNKDSYVRTTQGEDITGVISTKFNNKLKFKSATLTLTGIARGACRRKYAEKVAGSPPIVHTSEYKFMEKVVMPIYGNVIPKGAHDFAFSFQLAHDDPLSVHIVHPKSAEASALRKKKILPSTKVHKDKVFQDDNMYDVSYELVLHIRRGMLHKDIIRRIPIEVSICDHNAKWLVNTAMAQECKTQERSETVGSGRVVVTVTLENNVVRAGQTLNFVLQVTNPTKKPIRCFKLKFQRHSTLSATLGDMIVPMEANTNPKEFGTELVGVSVPANTIQPLVFQCKVPVPETLAMSYPVGFDYAKVSNLRIHYSNSYNISIYGQTNGTFFGSKNVIQVMFHVLVLSPSPQALTTSDDQALEASAAVPTPSAPVASPSTASPALATGYSQPSYLYPNAQPVPQPASPQSSSSPYSYQQPAASYSYPQREPPQRQDSWNLYPAAYPTTAPPAYEDACASRVREPSYALQTKPGVDPLAAENPSSSSMSSEVQLDPLAGEEEPVAPRTVMAPPLTPSEFVCTGGAALDPNGVAEDESSYQTIDPTACEEEDPAPVVSASVPSTAAVEVTAIHVSEEYPSTPRVYFPPIPSDAIVAEDDSDEEQEVQEAAEDEHAEAEGSEEEEQAIEEDSEDDEEEEAPARRVAVAAY